MTFTPDTEARLRALSVTLEAHATEVVPVTKGDLMDALAELARLRAALERTERERNDLRTFIRGEVKRALAQIDVCEAEMRAGLLPAAAMKEHGSREPGASPIVSEAGQGPIQAPPDDAQARPSSPVVWDGPQWIPFYVNSARWRECSKCGVAYAERYGLERLASHERACWPAPAKAEHDADLWLDSHGVPEWTPPDEAGRARPLTLVERIEWFDRNVRQDRNDAAPGEDAMVRAVLTAWDHMRHEDLDGIPDDLANALAKLSSRDAREREKAKGAGRG